ncbi:MAG: amidohydrolase family protein [Candidatus Gracilibacteria bacterium]|nr:amidohydrolase family protein [Candidatus Gracilibacteria bacterium]MDD2908643.1 amidohydrolase family protein [Candidatus Gracilibacteria bacterium]
MDIKQLLINNRIKNEILSTNKKDFFVDKITDLEKIKGSKYKMIDSHLHIVNFKQETEGLKKLLYYMDKSNIEKGVIFGMPVRKMWSETERISPDYYLDDDTSCYYDSFTDGIVAEEYNSLTKEEQKRFYPLICGFNPMDINAIRHIENMFKFYPGVFCGIGEILLRHDDLTFMTQGEPPRINNKAMYPIFEFACEYDLPILVHNNISSPGVSDHPKYLYELESILRDFPKAKIVFAHCGASRRINSPYYKKMIERLLSEYPALHIDYSWVVFDEIIMKNEETIKEWIELTEKFSDRILLGSDILGDGFHKIGYINNRFDIFLDMLTPKTRENLCIKNAEKLYSKKKNTVENNKKRIFPSLNTIEL